MDGHEHGYEYGYMDTWMHGLADKTTTRKIKEALVQWNRFLLQALLSLLLIESLFLSPSLFCILRLIIMGNGNVQWQ